MASSDGIPVLAVEDVPRVLKALARLLDSLPGIALAGTAQSGEEAVRKAEALSPRVVLMDLELPGMSGIEATRAIKSRSGAPEVLVLTSFRDEDKVFDSMRAGASGYLVKGAPAERLAEAIREVEAGGTVVEPRLARRLWAWFKGMESPAPPGPPPLDAQELEILTMVAKGLSNAEVAGVLGMQRRTVRTQLGHIYDKLGARSHVEAVMVAVKRGLIAV